ncbi:hypothetical protein [Pedobacter nutrimenti]|uniref:WG repeat protein n=1 Tax=Pedobacter nutrimenti TaxID=1241337 RepID=A0A318UY97_9SPHI|nr:hypothetical protein [Pedobacter nutrimenti]PYF76549.1 hypothetical protein B0O44_10120 [Pedobacter nutrimenti]
MKYIYLLLFLFVTSLTSQAQITLAGSDIPEVKKTPVAPYDSLLNFIMLKDRIQYRRLMGQRVFFAPFSEFKKERGDTRIDGLYPAKPDGKPGTYTFASTREYNVDPKTVLGKYFTILNVQTSYSFGASGKFVELEQAVSADQTFIIVLTLKKEENGDVFIFKLEDTNFMRKNPFILVPYFEKQKSLYTSRALVATGHFFLYSTNRQKLEINKGDQWTCKEVGLVDGTSFRAFYSPCYILADKSGNTVNYMFENFDPYFDDIEYQFVDEAYYHAKQLKNKQEAELAIKEQQKKFDDERTANLKKYGPKFGKLVNERNPTLGMTKDMCYSAWGAPDKKGNLVIKGLAQESWMYNHGDNRRTFLYFQNDKLVAKQTY